jgi:hypothetical protein
MSTTEVSIASTRPAGTAQPSTLQTGVLTTMPVATTGGLPHWWVQPDPRVYVRDVIVVNKDFQKRLNAISERFKDGKPLTFVARQIKHEKNQELKLTTRPFVFIADEYDGNGGRIVADGAKGEDGTKGANGAKGVAMQKKPGEPGKSATAGKQGLPGSPITILARSVHHLMVSSRGGAGGSGGLGGTGGDGGEGKLNTHGLDVEGTQSGAGGAGGDAARGGSGGLVTVVTVAQPASMTLIGAGGAPGSPGKGGKAGASQVGPPFPPPGKDGKPSTSGPSVAPKQSLLTSDAMWERLRSALGASASKWADHRTRVGKYQWRVQKDVTACAIELDAAMALAAHDEATRLCKSLNAGLNPIGELHQPDLKPDFSFYEDVVTDYAGLVLQIALGASALLQHALGTQQDKDALAVQVAHLRQLDVINQNSITSAQADIGIAELEWGLVDKQVQTVEADLNEVIHAMNPPADRWDQLLGVATALVAIAGAAYSGGATLAALPAAFGLLSDTTKLLKGVFDEKTNEIKIDGKAISEWKDSKEHKDVVGGLEDLVTNAKMFYDQVTIIAELGEKHVDSALARREIELTRRLAELDFQRRILSLRKVQAELGLDSAKQVQNVAKQDAEAIEKLAKSFSGDSAVLADLALRLIRGAQEHLDIHTKYVFYTARTLDLYTLQDTYASQVNFGLGYVHPDIEEDAVYALQGGSTAQILDLIVAYNSAVAKIPALQTLRDVWVTYDTALTKVPHQIWDITDPAVLDVLRTTHEVSVRIPLSSFPAGRAELKVTSVDVSLVGAKGKNAKITMEVEHSGNAENRTRTGAVKVLTAPALRGFVSATTDESVPPPDPDQPFWGRSPAALWRLKIDSTELSGGTPTKKLDLTGLTEIQLAIGYRFAKGSGG